MEPLGIIRGKREDVGDRERVRLPRGIELDGERSCGGEYVKLMARPGVVEEADHSSLSMRPRLLRGVGTLMGFLKLQLCRK